MVGLIGEDRDGPAPGFALFAGDAARNPCAIRDHRFVSLASVGDGAMYAALSAFVDEDS